MEIIMTRDGKVNEKINTGVKFDDKAAIKFLVAIMTDNESDENVKNDIEIKKTYL